MKGGASFTVHPYRSIEFTAENGLRAKRRGVVLSEDVEPFQPIANIPNSACFTTDNMEQHFQSMEYFPELEHLEEHEPQVWSPCKNLRT